MSSALKALHIGVAAIIAEDPSSVTIRQTTDADAPDGGRARITTVSLPFTARIVHQPGRIPAVAVLADESGRSVHHEGQVLIAPHDAPLSEADGSRIIVMSESDTWQVEGVVARRHRGAIWMIVARLQEVS